jgi:hypothetical protein
MAAAVSLLSPVIMTVRMPILRSWANRSLMPPLTTSLSESRPDFAALGHDQRRAAGAGNFSTRARSRLREFAAGLVHINAKWLRPRPCGCCGRAGRPGAGKSTPLMRVCAVNGTNCAWAVAATSRPRMLNFSLASTRCCGLRAFRRPATPVARRRPGVRVTRAREYEFGGLRLPSVMVPVLSSSSTSTSPAASTARPLMARTLRCGAGGPCRDADGAQQPADGGGNQADQQRDQHRARKNPRRNKCRTASASRRPAGKSASAPRAEWSARFRSASSGARAFDQRDHPVQKRVRRDRR